jgi:hypothetical protein
LLIPAYMLSQTWCREWRVRVSPKEDEALSR